MKLKRVSETFFKVAPWITNLLLVTGFGLMFAMAISPLFGWHIMIGWGSSLILLVILLDKKVGFLAALRKPWKKVERLFAFYLLLLIVISISVNLIVTWMQVAR